MLWYYSSQDVDLISIILFLLLFSYLSRRTGPALQLGQVVDVVKCIPSTSKVLCIDVVKLCFALCNLLLVLKSLLRFEVFKVGY